METNSELKSRFKEKINTNLEELKILIQQIQNTTHKIYNPTNNTDNIRKFLNDSLKETFESKRFLKYDNDDIKNNIILLQKSYSYLISDNSLSKISNNWFNNFLTNSIKENSPNEDLVTFQYKVRIDVTTNKIIKSSINEYTKLLSSSKSETKSNTNKVKLIDVIASKCMLFNSTYKNDDTECNKYKNSSLDTENLNVYKYLQILLILYHNKIFNNDEIVVKPDNSKNLISELPGIKNELTLTKNELTLTQRELNNTNIELTRIKRELNDANAKLNSRNSKNTEVVKLELFTPKVSYNNNNSTNSNPSSTNINFNDDDTDDDDKKGGKISQIKMKLDGGHNSISYNPTVNYVSSNDIIDVLYSTKRVYMRLVYLQLIQTLRRLADTKNFELVKIGKDDVHKVIRSIAKISNMAYKQLEKEENIINNLCISTIKLAYPDITQDSIKDLQQKFVIDLGYYKPDQYELKTQNEDVNLYNEDEDNVPLNKALLGLQRPDPR